MSECVFVSTDSFLQVSSGRTDYCSTLHTSATGENVVLAKYVTVTEGSKSTTFYCHPNLEMSRLETIVAMEMDPDFFANLGTRLRLQACAHYSEQLSREALERLVQALVKDD